MPQLARPLESDPHPAPRLEKGPTLLSLSDTTDWADSPARQLHHRLLENFTAPRVVDESRWSLQARLGTILGVAGALWLAIIAITVAILF